MTAEISSPPPFQLSLPLFEGTPEDLLRLCSAGKIDPEELHVSTVAAQVKHYVESSKALDLDLVGDVLATSARVLLLKSSRALSWDEMTEEEEPERRGPDGSIELLRRVASDLRGHEARESFGAPAPRIDVEKRLEPRPVSLLTRAWADMGRRSAAAAASVAVPAFVRLETAVSTFIRRLSAGTPVSFRRAVRGQNRRNAVVHFLAVLELVRRRQAVVQQDDLFADITILPAADESQATSRAG